MQDTQSKTAGEMLTYRITSKSHVSDIIPVIKVRESIFAIKGDISFVTGQAKAGKTQTVIPMLATALMETVPAHLDTLDIYTSYCEGKPVVYIDTEQPTVYTKRTILSVCKVLGVDKEPDNLYCFNLRKQKRDEKFRLIRELMREMRNTHLWIIDGIADLITDVNDTRQSFDAIDEFMQLSENLNTCVVLFLHENPGTNKMRGNLGSEAERKCGGTITIRKDRESGLHFIEPRMLRGSTDFTPIVCKWNDDAGRLMKLDNETSEKIRLEEFQNKAAKLFELAMLVFGEPNPVNYSDLIYQIRTKHDPNRVVSESTAKRLLKELTKTGLVLQNREGKYYPRPSLKSAIEGKSEGSEPNLSLFQ